MSVRTYKCQVKSAGEDQGLVHWAEGRRESRKCMVLRTSHHQIVRRWVRGDWVWEEINEEAIFHLE